MGPRNSAGSRLAGGSIQGIEGSEKVKSRHSGRNTLRRSSLLTGFISLSLWVGLLAFLHAPGAVAHEEEEVPQEKEEREVSQEEMERYEDAKKGGPEPESRKGR